MRKLYLDKAAKNQAASQRQRDKKRAKLSWSQKVAKALRDKRGR